MLSFRNIDASPDEPVETWPFEGVLTALERGGLPHWRRLARAIDDEPWGQVARHVEQAVAVARPFGIGPVMTDLITEARQRAEAAERGEVAADVRGFVDRSGLTRSEFASRIGTSTSRLSTYASGKVVPAATLMVRMRHVAFRAQAAAGVDEP
ncbi:helix-turn-helix domain-containing protein [Cellulomonas bogoriensis]|uniref:DNA-binding protein n=1 Tax=Cellulomonas bogoriensis 69B4 = DSM 16987 TaxID=1386082 RepID=A0A0A0BM03_9CELL|nr:helix-turn-helix transcriptional regulator [Cellulomonas bogoriensis]KGM08996.1 DNA-binding protein [Cellulomonas bogoriensis 69B4 = DSM 16987]